MNTHSETDQSSLRLPIPRSLYHQWLLRGGAILSFLVALWLAAHQSKHPVILDRYSLRYALVLFGLLAVAVLLWSSSITRWREGLARQRVASVSRKTAIRLTLAAALALPLSFAFLWLILPNKEQNAQAIGFLLLGEIAVMFTLLWWRGAVSHLILLRRPRWWFAAILGLASVYTLLFIGKLPGLNILDEIKLVGNSWYQFNDLDRYVSILTERNAETWFNFHAIRVFIGAYMRWFGVGILQARFFVLLIAWLSLPFLYWIARTHFGRAAAFASVGIALFSPLHFNLARLDYWLPTAITIALFCAIRARGSLRPGEGRRARFYSFFCGLFVVSAVEGHVYGGAFALVFCLLHIAQLIQSPRRGEGWRGNLCWPFFTGCFVFSLFWLAYHVALPGLSIDEALAALRETYYWERHAIGQSVVGGILNARIWWKVLLDLAFIQPYEMLLLALLVGSALWRLRKADVQLLALWGSSTLLIGLFMAHVFAIYFLHFFPLIYLLLASLLSDFTQSAELKQGNSLAFPLGALYLLFAVLCLFCVQAFTVANSVESISKRELLARYTEIGRDIHQQLPEEDIVVAGAIGYYLGMTERLNYAASFSFTWQEEKYWPLSPPQAIIVSPGLDDGYSGLAEWLLDHDFKALACYPIDVDRSQARAAILYVAPALQLTAPAANCSAELLGWLAKPS